MDSWPCLWSLNDVKSAFRCRLTSKFVITFTIHLKWGGKFHLKIEMENSMTISYKTYTSIYVYLDFYDFFLFSTIFKFVNFKQLEYSCNSLVFQISSKLTIFSISVDIHLCFLGLFWLFATNTKCPELLQIFNRSWKIHTFVNSSFKKKLLYEILGIGHCRILNSGNNELWSITMVYMVFIDSSIGIEKNFSFYISDHKKVNKVIIHLIIIKIDCFFPISHC